jgi:hypothetical protein
MPGCPRSIEYKDLLDAQRTLASRIVHPDIANKDLASCARVLVAVIDQKRIMRMKPKPKDVDTTKLIRRTRAAQPTPLATFDEPVIVTPTPSTQPPDEKVA